MENLVITISREFGSGGRLIGERLAEKLGFTFYDSRLISLAAGKSGLDPQVFENAEEEARSKFLFNLSIGGYVSTSMFSQVSVPISDQIFFAQSKVIEEIAEQGNCVIIGRCANYILRERPRLFRVFLYGDVKDRCRRIVEDYGMAEDKVEAQIAQVDKGRKNYYEHYTNEVWGDLKSYDLSLNTSFTGIDVAVKVISAAVQAV
ncbi:MAG: cytidylate kinase-like family protein [Synergistaceae bacterium]|jgi:cytidylate kinase|nr:cytidylate kinase-like family protein [Synergistaceae bacterium]